MGIISVLTNKRRGAFFSIDALIAVIILFIAILMLYPLSPSQKLQTETHRDILSALSALKIGEVDNAYVSSLIASGAITDANKTILEQIGEFYITDREKARELTASVLNATGTPENIGIWYENTLIYSRNTTPLESARNIESARQLLSGIREGSNLSGFTARASLSNSLRQKYAYFGGYVGDGNITLHFEYAGNITNATLEAATNTNFSLFVNGNAAGSYASSPDEFTPVTYTLPIASFQSGNNTLEFRSTTPLALHIAGGLVKVTYESDVEYAQAKRQHFPGVQGIINLYDSVYFSAKPAALDLALHYQSSAELQLRLGNTTLWNGSSQNETTLVLTNASLSSLLDYATLANKTLPLRLGLQEVLLNGTGGNADVILITDTSGSMDWRLNADVSGTARGCADPLLYSNTTKRISLAKCLDAEFVSAILAGTGNRVGLVSFSSSANSYVSLSSNITLLNSTIAAYTASGGTCVSCALNRAYLLLQAQSNSSRRVFIVTMTDGVTNYRSTSTCTDLTASGVAAAPLAGGANGVLAKRSPSPLWSSLVSPTANQIEDIDSLGESLPTFAVGANGIILSWNGVSWSSIASPVSTTLYGVEAYNATRAYAVGASGKVLRWDSATWSTAATISPAPTLYSITALNQTLLFAAGFLSNSGKIYKSTDGGTSWSEDYSGMNTLRGIVAVNATRAYTLGDNGELVRWSGVSWSSIASPTTHDLHAIAAANDTNIIAVGGDAGTAVIIAFNGNAWSVAYSNSSDSSLYDVSLSGTARYAVGDDATVLEFNGSTWQRSFALRPAYEGNATNGVYCIADSSSCSLQSSFPALNANYSACRARAELKATVYAIGFGPISTCTFAKQTLQSIAACGNGSFYASTDGAALQQFYAAIANDILRISYGEQTAAIVGNLSTRLFPDSYLQISGIQSTPIHGLVSTLEQQFSTNSSGAFSLPADALLVEAHVVSYSGPRWTSLLTLNTQQAYNLSAYGADYATLGDPFVLTLPTALINTTASNALTLTTGIAPNNTGAGSLSNKIIYTFVKNASAYAPLAALASGCRWTIQFEDNTNITTPIPASYQGIEQCSYTPSSQAYTTNDALQAAVFSLLQKLDFNANQKVDVKFSEQDLDVQLAQVTGIPYTWSTEVQVRVWN